ncbi:TetR family transcriptional regulator C-terminal domain-containing protein [Mycobacterium hubeiense]|uniref:TetR family transcriptional regulator C-terminal domain-containing protein n=1 Tax=Mycobacterium hubeiense TaxID=1867256 RepID=UPI003D6648F5
MLRDNVREYADPDTPPGCLIVLAGIAYSTETQPLRDLLKKCRDEDRQRLLGRIRGAMKSGELPANLDADALAAFMMTVLYGLSIQARDGATLQQLESTVDLAMRTWDDVVTSARRAPDAPRA